MGDWGRDADASAPMTRKEVNAAMKCYCGARNGSKASDHGEYFKCRNGHLYLVASRLPEKK